MNRLNGPAINRLTSLAAILLMAACAPRPTAPATGSVPATPATASAALPKPLPLALAIEGEGLRLFNPVNGAARSLPFGTDRTLVMTALAGRGSADSGTQSDCGAGPLDYAVWPDGLMLYFQQDKLTGWALDGRAAGKVTTAAGIGPGSSRAELEATYAATVMQSTLGTEFIAGDLYGLLDGPGPKASIAAMWAGVSCNFR